MTTTPSPRVGLDVTQAIKRRGRGIARYIRQVVAAQPEDALPTDLFIRGHRWFRRGLFDGIAPQAERRWMPNQAHLGARDLALFHSFGNHLPRQAPCPLTFTVHDVRALDEPAGYEGKERLQRNLGRAAGIVCLTGYGRARLLHHRPELAEREIAVIPHGVDHAVFRPLDASLVQPVRQALGLDMPFLLQLGSWFPHKNLELSLAAWAESEACRSGIDLAYVGGGAPDSYRQELEARAERLGLAQRVHWIDHVGGSDLPALIRAATCLLQPSRYEGFALPLLEAMACGTPGVVSDSSCLPEVSAGLWPVAGVDDPGAFARGIDRMALDEGARDRAIRGGLTHAADFTWERSARAHDSFYRTVIARADD